MIASLHFLAFQAIWFTAVFNAAAGQPGVAALSLAAFLMAHVALVPRGQRRAEVRFLLATAVLGTLADGVLQASGALVYAAPAESWLPPLWITGLWAAFASLVRFSLAWLRERRGLAALLGALGGPLSYLGALRIGAVGTDAHLLLAGGSALEYALATPLLLRWAPRRSTLDASRAATEAA